MVNPLTEYNLLIVTGLSGAGKTKSIKLLEDLGFFCVDNLPVALLSGFASLTQQDKGRDNRLTAVVIDVREGEDFQQDLFQALHDLNEKGIPYSILFLEASDEVLVRRFSETRRKHPLSSDGGILTAILKERSFLGSLREKANYIIDTSNYSLKDLREKIISIVTLLGDYQEKDHMAINLLSFGYKCGVPIDADIVMDVRFLPNPFYEEELKDLTGLEDSIRSYVTENNAGKEFIQKFTELLLFLVPLYKKEGKSQITVAFGCTGGKHRSVAIAKLFKQILTKRGYNVHLINRDIYADDELGDK